MKPKLKTAPAEDPVTLQDVKDHLRVTFSDDDAYLQGLVKAATGYFDGYRGVLNRCIMPQTWTTTHFRFWREMNTLFTDTTDAVVTYIDADGNEQTVDDADYTVYSDCIKFNSDFTFPALYSGRDDVVKLETTHGYDEVPETLKLAIKILVAHWYRNREPVTFGGSPTSIPYSVETLIAPHRMAF